MYGSSSSSRCSGCSCHPYRNIKLFEGRINYEAKRESDEIHIKKWLIIEMYHNHIF